MKQPSPRLRRGLQPRLRPLPALAALLLVGLTAACSSGASDSSASDSAGSASAASSASEVAGDVVGAPAPADAAADDAAADASSTGERAAGGAQGGVAVDSQKAVISTGTVSLRSTDVGQLLFDVQKAVDTHRGDVSERSSESDRKGAVIRSRLVVRVPADAFGDLMGALEQTGTLISSDSSSEDVTAQVIDNQVRVSVQKASIDRIQALLAQATDLKDVVSIEAELSTRQAELNSLEQTQAYLADQTAQSTITVSLERTRTDTRPVEEADETGFVAGLTSGWDALSGVGTALATVVGALLPWLAVGAVVAVPGVPLVRRLRRRTPRGAGAPASV